MASPFRIWSASLLVVGAVSIVQGFHSSSFNDLPFHHHNKPTVLPDEMDMFSNFDRHNHQSNCTEDEIWCEMPANPYHNYYDDLDSGDGTGSNRGFWLEPPPDDILWIPPPPMPAALQAFFGSMENESMREFIFGEDPIEGVRCNFCKMFADPKMYQEESESESRNETENFMWLFYVLIVSLAFVFLGVVCLLLKYNKFRLFSNSGCPFWWSSGNHVMGHHHHHKSSSSASTSPSDTCLSPVVNEKSPQSIIMDAPLASLGKKSTISTTGKYWKRIPNNNGHGNILFMDDRRGLRSLGGSSTGISDHPYSDAASCTSSPVYAELDPAVAAAAAAVGGSCHTPPIIGSNHMGATFGPYAFGNTYTEVPEPGMRSPANLLGSDHSSTYDNAAYLSASSQPFLPGHHAGVAGYTSRSLRRLAAQRSAAMAAGTIGNRNQISTPLLSGGVNGGNHPAYPPYGPQNFLTGGGGRQLRRSRNSNATPPLSVNYFKYGQTLASRPMNHYVMTNETSLMMMDEMDDLGVITDHHPQDNSMFGSSFLQDHHQQNRKSTSSSQYTEMPLIPANNSTPYRISETHSNNDLNSAASSSSGGGGGGSGGGGRSSSTTNTSSATTASSTSLKRPLPPVPGGGGGGVRL